MNSLYCLHKKKNNGFVLYESKKVTAYSQLLGNNIFNRCFENKHHYMEQKKIRDREKKKKKRIIKTLISFYAQNK